MIWLLLLLLQGSSEPEEVVRGRAVFAQSCAVGYCHGAGGAAGQGPRLYGRNLDPDQVARVIREGVPNSAMLPWKDLLPEQEIEALVAYIMRISALGAPDPIAAMPPGVGPARFIEFPGPPEAKRGYDLFFDSTRLIRCATCHTASGRGIAIGPDVAAVSFGTAREFVSRVQNASSRTVVRARLRDGDAFPALVVDRTGTWVRLYDLSSPRPVLRTLDASLVQALERTAGWGHASTTHSYTDPEIEAIADYVQWLNRVQ